MSRFPDGPPPRSSRPTKVDELIDSRLMARLDHLDVVSRKIFNGRVQGERRSKRRGQSVEFADFRPYVHGDDLRFVDWNIYGRLDRLFLKIFLEEEDLSLIVVVDGEPGATILLNPGSGDFSEAEKIPGVGATGRETKAPTRQKELLLSVVIRPFVRRHKPQKRRRVAAHEARRPQGPL